MFFGGIDAHEHYLVVAVVDTRGRRTLAPTRVSVSESDALLELLLPFRPLLSGDARFCGLGDA